LIYQTIENSITQNTTILVLRLWVLSLFYQAM